MDNQPENKEFSIFNTFDLMVSGPINIVSRLAVDFGINIMGSLFNVAGSLIDLLNPSKEGDQK